VDPVAPLVFRSIVDAVGITLTSIPEDSRRNPKASFLQPFKPEPTMFIPSASIPEYTSSIPCDYR